MLRVAAMFGAAGLGTAWLGGVALLAAPLRPWLLLGAAACALVGGGLLWRGRAALCRPGAACTRPQVRHLTRLTLALTAILAVLGYLIV